MRGADLYISRFALRTPRRLVSSPMALCVLIQLQDQRFDLLCSHFCSRPDIDGHEHVKLHCVQDPPPPKFFLIF